MGTARAETRPRRVVLPVLCLVVLGLVLSGCSLTGKSGDTIPGTPTSAGETTTNTTASTSASAPTTTATSASTISTTSADEELSSAEIRTPDGHVRAMGYIRSAWEDGGERYIQIDYAEMLTGEAANEAARDAGLIGPGEDVPNDYFIRNVNPKLREFSVWTGAPIQTSTWGGVWERMITWPDFLTFWHSPPADGAHMKDMPWWIERSGNEVLLIEEQYIP